MLESAIHAAKEAGAFIKERYQRKTRISYKDSHNIVSAVDLGAERIILDALGREFPRHSFFSEEKGMVNKNSDFLWIIDPLDGTTNFTRHFPHFCVSIALAKRGEVILGVVYNPMRDELFSAQKGKGAFLNGKRIRDRDGCTLEESVIMINRGANAKEKARHGDIVKLMGTRCRSIRIVGSTALDLCYVALARFDALIQNGCMFYDCAGGNLIAKESGLLVTDFLGRPWNLAVGKTSDILVSNPGLHVSLLDVLRESLR